MNKPKAEPKDKPEDKPEDKPKNKPKSHRVAKKWVYLFGKKKTEGKASMRDLLGGKGANLCEMSEIGLNVPPGFIITTEACRYFYKHKEALPPVLKTQLRSALCHTEQTLNESRNKKSLSQKGCKRFGDPAQPLLFSVRSGAPVSMPGMMDTVLNLGLNDRTMEGLALVSRNRRFALDSYRRFIHMYANVVLNIPHHPFESRLEDLKSEANCTLDTELQEQHLERLVAEYKTLVLEFCGQPFPQNPELQLWAAIRAVFKSWQTPRAQTYRRLNKISDKAGTAVTIQTMVFGNMGTNCMTGVAFTRNPSTGENRMYGEYLVNAQGEDVVSGIRTPMPLTEHDRKSQTPSLPSMERKSPKIFAELMGVRKTLERHYRDMQDIEFTVENNRLFLLQTRSGKRTAQAAVVIASSLVREKLLSREQALLRLEPQSLEQLLHPRLDPTAPRKLLTRGLPASPGAACGQITFSADEAEERTRKGLDVVLVRTETSPEDIHGMHAARGILTARGGMTSHAAVVARGMGRACVCGANEVQIDMKRKTLSVRNKILYETDFLTIDGSNGEVYLGKVPMIHPELDATFHEVMGWADSVRRMRVRANVDTAEDALMARSFGAEGIGLCRTEHMFFDEKRISAMRRMILAETKQERLEALSFLLPMQRTDFVTIFQAMDGLPVTIRLLDPPLHEFLPHKESELAPLLKQTNLSREEARRRIARLQESNPMLGHRGCRLLVTYPEICAMQSRAIFEAILEARAKGAHPLCEIMLPLIATRQEFDMLAEIVAHTAAAVLREQAAPPIEWQIGTMVELPRAAMLADEIAGSAAFFSFGTNDLTQTVWGISRDDAGRFLQEYERLGFIAHDPFTTLDVKGVGALIEIACRRGRSARPDLKMGICGEHGGDPSSIHFCERQNLDYVSCSPYRVPIARLAAAQAALVARAEGGDLSKRNLPKRSSRAGTR